MLLAVDHSGLNSFPGAIWSRGAGAQPARGMGCKGYTQQLNPPDHPGCPRELWGCSSWELRADEGRLRWRWQLQGASQPSSPCGSGLKSAIVTPSGWRGPIPDLSLPSLAKPGEGIPKSVIPPAKGSWVHSVILRVSPLKGRICPHVSLIFNIIL